MSKEHDQPKLFSSFVSVLFMLEHRQVAMISLETVNENTTPLKESLSCFSNTSKHMEWKKGNESKKTKTTPL